MKLSLNATFFRCAVLASSSGLASGAFADLQASVYVTGLSAPVAMEQDPTQPSVQLVLQQAGLIRVVVNGVLQPNPFLNLTSLVSYNGLGSERGLLGLAFHPQYAQNRYFYVNYTDVSGNTQITRYTRDPIDPLKADPNSAYPIISIQQPYANHNAGTLRFGPLDGYLYVAMGDGGSGNDPGNRAQTITNMLLGKILRLNVNGDDFPADPLRNYSIPPTNPFVGITGDDELWSIGLRNPWKFCFDNPAWLGTGGMVIADVGQSQREEIDYEPPLAKGRNYGWRVLEGTRVTGLSGGGNNIPFTDPIYEYTHSVGRSITGGYVSRGIRLADHFGRYFFCDYMTGKVFSFMLNIHPQTGEGSVSDFAEHTAELGWGQQYLSSMDVDANGDLYIVDYTGGKIYKLYSNKTVWPTAMRGQGAVRCLGTLRHILGSDDKYMVAFPLVQFGYMGDLDTNVQFDMQTDFIQASWIDARIEAHSFRPGITWMDVGLKNWNSGNVVYVGTIMITNSDQTQQVTGIPAANFVRNDGRIELYLRAAFVAGVQPEPYSVAFDRVDLDLR